MSTLKEVTVTIGLCACVSTAAPRAESVRHEAHAWWKPQLPEESRQLRLRVDLPTEPFSGTTELSVVIEIADGESPQEQLTEVALKAWVIDDEQTSDPPVFVHSVDWTLGAEEPDETDASEPSPAPLPPLIPGPVVRSRRR